MHRFDIAGVEERLAADSGGYGVEHDSSGMEVGVHVLVALEPDRQQPHRDDENDLVLEGRGTLEVEGESLPLEEGEAFFWRPAPSTASRRTSSSPSS